jgi:hypothetical protein
VECGTNGPKKHLKSRFCSRDLEQMWDPISNWIDYGVVASAVLIALIIIFLR